MLLSVIVPVYNAEKYLKQCLDSIVCQLNDQSELIIINDGSTDGSAAIIESYAENYPGITIINQCNCGASAARNAGLHAACGDYVAFIDADDIVLENYIATLLDDAVTGNRDLVCYSSIVDGKYRCCNRIVEHIVYARETEFADFLKLYYKDCLIGFEVWGKLFRRDIIIQKKLSFSDRRVVFAEDWLFNIEYLSFCENIMLSPLAVYFHKFNTDSLMNIDKKDYMVRLLNACDCCFKYYETNKKLAVVESALPFLFRDLLLHSVHKNLECGASVKHIVHDLKCIDSVECVARYIKNLDYIYEQSIVMKLTNYLLSNRLYFAYAVLKKIWFSRKKIGGARS